jgi:hypothetical protein
MDEDSRKELERHTDQLRSDLSGAREFASEVFDARQSFYQHLMLLNAGTLSLLFTVILALAASNHLTSTQIHGTGHLLTGCWLLVLSIVLSLLHNHFNVSFLIHSGSSFISNAATNDTSALYITLQRAGIDSPVPEEGAKIAAGAERSRKASGHAENVCRVLGPVAQGLTIVAYVEFVSSIRSIVLSIAK